MNIDCLIPSAGLSSRMGRWKLTLPYKESTIIENCISHALLSCSRVIIVVGFRSEELVHLVHNPPRVITTLNDNFENGMFSSIQKGVSLVESEWFFITMGDMPDITENIYKSLIEARNSNYREFDIIRPIYKGERGHPVLLHKKTIQTILAEPVLSKMKNVFTHFNVLDIDMNLPDTFRDIDTPEEYRRIMKKDGL